MSLREEGRGNCDFSWGKKTEVLMVTWKRSNTGKNQFAILGVYNGSTDVVSPVLVFRAEDTGARDNVIKRWMQLGSHWNSFGIFPNINTDTPSALYIVLGDTRPVLRSNCLESPALRLQRARRGTSEGSREPCLREGTGKCTRLPQPGGTKCLHLGVILESSALSRTGVHPQAHESPPS